MHHDMSGSVRANDEPLFGSSSVQLCLSFVRRCLCLRFVVRAGHANRAFIIDVHVFCASLQTNTDS